MEHVQLPPVQQRLFANGVELVNEDAPLGALGVVADMTVFLKLDPNGAPDKQSQEQAFIEGARRRGLRPEVG